MAYPKVPIAAALLAASAITVSPALAERVTPGPVVNADWLAEHRGEVAVLDVRRNLDAFAEAHIAGAAPVSWDAVRTTRVIDGVERQKVRLDAETFQQLMRDAGVDTDEPVVITSPGKAAGQITTQARLYWTFAYYGHDDVAILDGGNAAWRAAGHDMATGEVEITAGDYTSGNPDESVLATVAEVDAARTDAGVQLTDNRPMPYYLGLEQAGYVYAAGHIPSAVNVPFTLNVSAKGPATLRDTETLRAVYAHQGASMDNGAIAYCNSGHVSALTWFVMSKVLGNENAQLFDGSMHVWTQDASRPVTNPARP
ncbi:sulfurtransferase [Rhodovibrio salinarum]|uniref:Rhodanese-like domain-containing protein n=1 Tax=Rhodovibrio salinarum TaxID=1087 RepID=A0A934QJY5_9PROT|nr:rhodanese-like domain-containing protein [Rhodovibrio salinarum]MBK1698268.1 rhodanese-like domain-containing protein [Rhodovibrio salinarum]